MNPKNFIDPPAADRLVPFWIWNGTIEENELVRQIREMSEKGLGGFCLATGPGLKTPYLSQVWFDRVKLAIETAETCGLHVWIHDEYRYPGSIGSTQITLNHPQFIAQQLTFRETVVQGGQLVDLVLPWAPVLQALAVPVRRDRCLWEEKQDISAYLGVNHQHHALRANDSVSAYHPSTYLSFDPTRRLYWKAPPGRWRVLVFLQEPSATPECPGLHLDRFNPESVRTMHQTIQHPYIERFATYQSKTLKGILTAETRFPHDHLPWSPILPEYFKSRNGYDLLACLPALITYFGLNTSRIRYDYFQTLGELQHRHNSARCADWCKEHALHYASNITPLRNAHRSSIPIPGTSSGQEHAVSYGYGAGFATALGAQTNADRVLNTCFQNTGWGLTLQDMKVQLDTLGAQGTNFFIPNACYYTLDSLRKHGPSPSLFHQNPYWKHFRLLSDYAGRLAHLLRQGQQVADIALLDPVTSLWAHLSHPYHNWSYVGYDPDEETLAQHLVADWACITSALYQMQRPFHSLDPALLAQAKIINRQLQIGKARYAVLVIPPITNLERAAFEKLRTFINTGGLVIALGLLPIEDIQEGASVVEGFSRLTDMEPGRMIRDYTGHESGVHLLNRDNFLFIRTGGTIEKNQATSMLERLLDEILPRRVHIIADGKNADAIQYHHRADEKHHIFFFVNTENAPITTQINIPASAGQLERWDLETGKRTPLQAESTGEMSRFNLHFDRLQSHLIATSKGRVQPQRAARPKAPLPEPLKLDLGGLWKVDLEEDNALRFDNFKIQRDPENRGAHQNWHQPTYADHRWSKTRPRPFENPKEKTVYWYRTSFVADFVPNKLSLVMDRSAIRGAYQIYINGFQLPDNAFRPTFRYDHANATCSVAQRITKGKNVIAIRLEVNRSGDGLVDAMYLFGRFQIKSWRGVYPRLSPLQENGSIFDLQAHGLPFYAGTVAYSRDIEIDTLPKTERFELDFERAMKNIADVVEIKMNGHSLGVRAWPPYRWTGETAWLRQGKNRVVIRLTNTLEKLITGMTFHPRTHKMVPVEI